MSDLDTMLVLPMPPHALSCSTRIPDSRPVGHTAFTLEFTKQSRPVSFTQLTHTFAAGHSVHADLYRLADEVFTQRNHISSARQAFHLLAAGLFKTEHPQESFGDRSADRKSAMVAQDHYPTVRT